MRRTNYFLLLGLIILVCFSIFTIQNRVFVPVRLTFDRPGLYFLPVVVMVSFISGIIIGVIFVLFYFAEKKIRLQHQPLKESRTTEKTKNDIIAEDKNITLKEVNRRSEKGAVSNLNPGHTDKNDSDLKLEIENCRREIDDIFKSVRAALKLGDTEKGGNKK